MSGDRSVSGRGGGIAWSRLLGPPVIALVLVGSWGLPIASWTLALVGGVSTVVFIMVAVAHRGPLRSMLVEPVVVATLVMYAIALFTLAYGSLSLVEPGSVETNGAHDPSLLGVAALLATAMGIAGGEVGAHMQYGARIVAHVQLLLVIGAVAGVGGQIARRLAESTGREEAGPPPVPVSLMLDLYARVYQRLSEQVGDRALDESQLDDPEVRGRLKREINELPKPALATETQAAIVFNRIRSGDLEHFYQLPFEGATLGTIVGWWLDLR